MQVMPDQCRQVGELMSDMQKGQAQRPDPIGADNALQAYAPGATNTDKRTFSDFAVWLSTSRQATDLIEKALLLCTDSHKGDRETARSIAVYYATYWPDMRPSKSNVAKNTGIDRSTVIASMQAMCGVEIFAEQPSPTQEKSYYSPVWNKLNRTQGQPVGEPVGEPVVSVQHKQNTTNNKTEHVPGLYQLAMKDLASNLVPDPTARVNDLFMSALTCKPEWKDQPHEYGQALLRMSRGITSPGGMITVMQKLAADLESAQSQQAQQLQECDCPMHTNCNGKTYEDTDNYMTPVTCPCVHTPTA